MENIGINVNTFLEKIDKLLVKDWDKTAEEHWLCRLEEDDQLSLTNVYFMNWPIKWMAECNEIISLYTIEKHLSTFYYPQTRLLRNFFNQYPIEDCRNNDYIMNMLENVQDDSLVLFNSGADYLKRLSEKGLKLFDRGKMNKIKPNYLYCSEVSPLRDFIKDTIDPDWQDPIIILKPNSPSNKPFIIKRAKPSFKREDELITVRYTETLELNCSITKYVLI